MVKWHNKDYNTLNSPDHDSEVAMLNIEEKIYHIFKTHQVVDMKILQTQLNNRSTRSVFRDLENEGYYSSFSHFGKYYTLKKIPQFNTEGLWFYQNIGFSKYGTLKNTLAHLIKNSDSGKTHDVLRQQLHIRVQNSLLNLVREGKIIRRKIDGDYVYFSNSEKFSEKQISLREEYVLAATLADISDWIVIQILASIIRTSVSGNIESSKIVSELQLKKITVTKNQVDYVLSKLDLKKTLGSA
jgi:hypothetical protein